MKLRMLIPGLLALLFLASCASTGYIAADHVKDLPEFNRIVLDTLRSFPTDGTHDYAWTGGYDGSSRDVILNGKRFMKGTEKGTTYCCGSTLEVFLESYKTWLKKHGGERASALKPKDYSNFKSLWFVRDLNGPGPSAALEKYDLGRTIDLDEALAGDFVQIWRTIKPGRKKPSGHSVVFINWIKDRGGRIQGFKYWSSQPGTDGIGYQEEMFGPDGGIAGVNTWFGRVEPRAVKVPRMAKKKVKKAEKKATKDIKKAEDKVKKTVKKDKPSDKKTEKAAKKVKKEIKETEKKIEKDKKEAEKK